MAIKIDGKDMKRAWPTDQALVPLDAVDYYVTAKNLDDTYVPQSQKGKGADKDPDPTTKGGGGTDTVR